MMGGMAAFMAAVGGTSLICFLLMNRVQNRGDRRQSAGGGDSGTSSSDSSGSGGWNLLSWFGSVLRPIVPPRPAIAAGTAEAAEAAEAVAAIDARYRR
jgi:hypothetical protein